MDRTPYLALALLLVSCGQPQHASMEDAAEDAAEAATEPKFAEMQSKIDDLQTQLNEVSAKEATGEVNANTLFEKQEWDDRAINRLYDNQKIIAERVGIVVKQENEK